MTFYDILNYHLYTIGDTAVTVATVATVLVIAIVTFWASFVLQRALARLLALGGVTDRGSVGVARRIAHYIVLAIGVVIGLQHLGVNLSTLFAAGAIFAVGLGFAAQNILENFASGLILLVERTIKPGDVLQVDDETVQVMSMGFRSTVVRTRDEEDMIVPNSILVQNKVVNYTLRDSLYRLRTRVGVVYGSDMRRVMEVLTDAARAIPWRLMDRDPVILLAEFADSSVIFDVSVWIDDPWRLQRTRSELNQAVWWALKDAGIVIAFPQLDVHLDSEVVSALGAATKAGGA